MKQELIIKKKELPEGWKICKLVDVTNKRKSGVNQFECTKKYISTGDLQHDDISFTEVTYKNRPSRANMGASLGDIIFAKMKNTDKVLIIDETHSNNLYSTGFYVLEPNERYLVTKFLYYYLKSDFFKKQKNTLAKGATQKAINDSDLKEIVIVLPPLPIQQKIVSKLDKQMAQIEMMKKEAEKAMESLKIMFGSYLLKIFDQGFPTKKLGDLINKIQNGVYKPAQFRTKGKKMVRMYNIENDSIVLNDNNLQEIELSDDEKTKYILDKDDILLSRVNSAELVGKCGIVKDKLVGYAFENMIIRIKVNQNRIIPDYLAFFLISQKGKKEIRGITRHAINQSSINNTDVKTLNIPLTNDLNEQLEIVHYLNQKYGVINSLQNHFKKRIESITHLTSSILNEVFGQYEIPEEA